MTSRDFCFWLQGGAELVGEAPTADQWKVIKAHLNLVFVHEIDPSMGDAAHQETLNNIHHGTNPPFGGAGNGPIMRC